MTFLITVWRFMIMFTFSTQGCPQLPPDSNFISFGNLTVEPSSLFLMGSNLTVYCHINKCDFRYGIYLELNKRNVNESKRVNCTTQMFSLYNIWTPRSSVVCKMKTSQQTELIVVNGKDLCAGLPPDKPVNISCETTRSSDLMDCSWVRGRETHMLMFYNISVFREDGIQVYSGHIVNRAETIIPRTLLDESSKFLLNITAYNHFGESQSDPFIFCLEDIVIPETPGVIKVEFGNNSLSAVLHWKTSESAVLLKPDVRLRVNNGSWELRGGTELSEGLIRVDDLRPLTEYELQIRTCDSPSGHKNSPGFSTGETSRSRCSRWSPAVRKMSLPKVPSQQLHVWRIFAGRATDGLRNITVLWKPPSPEDYSGKLLRYKLLLDDGEKVCAAASTQCDVQVSAELQALSVSAVTPYGASPPANVELRHADVVEPIQLSWTPAADGSSALVSWSSTFGEELLHFVVEWESVPAGELQWKKLTKDLRNTSISALSAGVRYNVSLYAVTTRGVSAPTSRLFYSKEDKPVSCPTLFVLVHESRRILVQWVELPVDQQKGFITDYTIYLQTVGSSSTEYSRNVSGSGPTETWLDCPEGVLTLQMTASNSAGEGPRGRRISSQPDAPAVGLVIVIVFAITVFFVIVLNLMCWSCVRKRIKQKCISWGPKWLVENLPKPGRSNAIRLLEDDRSEPLFSSTYSDPPLSPILVISQEEMDEVYPTIHVEESQSGSAVDDTRTILAEHASYKPQLTTLVPFEEEEDDAEEKSLDFLANKNQCSDILEGLLEGLVLSTDVDYSESSQGLNLSSVSGLLWPKNADVILLNSVLLEERRGDEDEKENKFLSLDLQQDHKRSPDTDETGSSQCPGETLNSGYFPQLTSLSTAALDR